MPAVKQHKIITMIILFIPFPSTFLMLGITSKSFIFPYSDIYSLVIHSLTTKYVS